MEQFIEFATQCGMSVQRLDDHHILVGYKGNWEVFTCGEDLEDIFRQVWDMLCSAHWVEEYLPEDLVRYASELHGEKDLTTIWEEWQLDKSYYSKFQPLLGFDFDLFVERALEV